MNRLKMIAAARSARQNPTAETHPVIAASFAFA